MLKTDKIRADFPALSQTLNQKPIIYLDSACMSLKPKSVIDEVVRWHSEFPACHGRSGHTFGEKTTQEFEKTRQVVARFINAKPNEIIFTRNTTEGINLIAYSLYVNSKPSKGQSLGGDRPLVATSDKEHNSNLVPWLELKKRGLIEHQVLPSLDEKTTQGNITFWSSQFNLERLRNLSTPQSPAPNLLSLVYTSNLDGTTNPIELIVKIAHGKGFLVLLDAAQAAPHQKIDVKKINVDFLAFSGHKMLGPSGVGVLYAKEKILKNLSPFMTGGDTVVNSWYDRVEFLEPPQRFEAGLQNYAGAMGLTKAIEYLEQIGLDQIHNYEIKLNRYLTEKVSELADRLNCSITVLGPPEPEERGGIFSFIIQGFDNHQIMLLLNNTQNIMVRSGGHCVHSWFNARGLRGSVRVSFYLYNTKTEVDLLIKALEEIILLN